jgi:hypothetical protein
MNNKGNTGIITIGVLIFFTLINLYIFGFSNLKNLTDQHGFLGDFINGLSSPVIGLTTTILLVLTLKAQLDTTKAQIEFNQEDKADKLLDFLYDSFNDVHSMIINTQYPSIYDSVPELKNKLPADKIQFHLRAIRRTLNKNLTNKIAANSALQELNYLTSSQYFINVLSGLQELIIIQKQFQNNIGLLGSSKPKFEIIHLKINRKTLKDVLNETSKYHDSIKFFELNFDTLVNLTNRSSNYSLAKIQLSRMLRHMDELDKIVNAYQYH